MKHINIFCFIASALAGVSCVEQEIPVFKAEDSVVYFQTTAVEYSLKGVNTETATLSIPLYLMGSVCDYDREVRIELTDSSYVTAQYGEDFKIVSACVPAGAMTGSVVLDVKVPDDSRPYMVTSLEIKANEHFKRIQSDRSVLQTTWSKDFARPTNQYAWQSWYYFFAPCYSKALHAIIIDVFGTDIERTSHVNGARKDEDSIYKMISWWYSASRQLRDYVKEHDVNHPFDPYMHSEDYEAYRSYLTPVGSGTRPDEIPTILSTLYTY